MLYYVQIDMVDLSSWQAQLRGKKTWSLIPPPECEHKCHAFNVTMETGDVRECMGREGGGREGGEGRGRERGTGERGKGRHSSGTVAFHVFIL